jgi:predicted nucleic acid-binding protein
VTEYYVDAMYYIALVNPRDTFHRRAHELTVAIKEEPKITSEPILTELLDHFSTKGSYFRIVAHDLVDAIRNDPTTSIVSQTPELWHAGLELYRHRPDKGYSHIDCMSMEICKARKIKQVLTHDHHFAQEGFEILL